jgi:hypothetical protein
MDYQILFNIAVAIAGFFGGWTLNLIYIAIDRLDGDARSMPAAMGLALFASVMAPASFFLGFAVATAGFTCWNLTVPILFNWLSFDLFDALFLSIMMDTMSSLVLVLLYLRHGKVDVSFVLHFGGVAALAGALSSRLSDAFLESHTQVLRGAGDAAELGDLDKITDTTQVHGMPRRLIPD